MCKPKLTFDIPNSRDMDENPVFTNCAQLRAHPEHRYFIR